MLWGQAFEDCLRFLLKSKGAVATILPGAVQTRCNLLQDRHSCLPLRASLRSHWHRATPSTFLGEPKRHAQSLMDVDPAEELLPEGQGSHCFLSILSLYMFCGHSEQLMVVPKKPSRHAHMTCGRKSSGVMRSCGLIKSWHEYLTRGVHNSWVFNSAEQSFMTSSLLANSVPMSHKSLLDFTASLITCGSTLNGTPLRLASSLIFTGREFTASSWLPERSSIWREVPKGLAQPTSQTPSTLMVSAWRSGSLPVSPQSPAKSVVMGVADNGSSSWSTLTFSRQPVT